MNSRVHSVMDLQPGDIGFGPIGGRVGFLVSLGQLIIGDASRYHHVFVVTEAGYYATGPNGERVPVGPRVVEAMPSGARQVKLSTVDTVGDGGDRWDDRYMYFRLRGAGDVRAENQGGVHVGSILSLGETIAHHARRMVGTPYGFSDYLALGLRHLGIRLRRLDRWIARTDPRGYPMRAICSQLADMAYTLAGVKVFDDGRLPQDVTPGALHYRCAQWVAEGRGQFVIPQLRGPKRW